MVEGLAEELVEGLAEELVVWLGQELEVGWVEKSDLELVAGLAQG